MHHTTVAYRQKALGLEPAQKQPTLGTKADAKNRKLLAVNR